MRKLVYLIVVLVALGLIVAGCCPVVPPAEQGELDNKAKPGGCATIQDGTIVASTGETLTTGYDKWGYNYQSHMFNGLYSNYSRPEPPYTIDTAPSKTWLIMKWSDTWLSNKDCNGDTKLDRGYDCDSVNANSSACEGAWLTNHQWGEYVNDDGETCEWDYFVKIVYPLEDIVDIDPADGIDDNTGGSIIWESYIRIQQISNDPCLGEYGNIFAIQPTGFGVYK